MKTNTLDLKLFADEFVQINAPRDHIAPRSSGRAIVYFQFGAKRVENIEGKKRDLPLVVVFEIEIPISANPTPGDTFDFRHFDHRERIGFTTVVADKIVPGRNVKVANFH